jgi:hypothetical protein
MKAIRSEKGTAWLMVMFCMAFVIGIMLKGCIPQPAHAEEFRRAADIGPDWKAHEDKIAEFLMKKEPRFKIRPIILYRKGDPALFLETFGAQADTVYAWFQSGIVTFRMDYDVNKEPEILAHEMYHAFAWINSLKFECPAMEERAAYQIQSEYMKEELNGEGIFPSPFFLATLSCPPKWRLSQ